MEITLHECPTPAGNISNSTFEVMAGNRDFKILTLHFIEEI
jgi:hypothetical protein